MLSVDVAEDRSRSQEIPEGTTPEDSKSLKEKSEALSSFRLSKEADRLLPKNRRKIHGAYEAISRRPWH